MNHNAIPAGLLAAALLLSGCTGRVVSNGPAAGSAPQSSQDQSVDATPVKTGLSITADLSDSDDGLAQAEITLVAVTVDDNGRIDRCAIDMVESQIVFDDTGALVTDPTTLFESKDQLGQAYGMQSASSLGKEWNEQAAAFAQYVTGKTVAELGSIALTEDEKPAGADLAASVTISVGDFLEGVQKAAANAVHLGAQMGDALVLENRTTMGKSRDAAAGVDGSAQTDCSVAVITLRDGWISSCLLDGLQAAVNFDTEGDITSDTDTQFLTKNQLGDAYGLHEASSIGLEWNEQAAAFAHYVTGRTLEDVAGIAVNDERRPTDADLAASVTISIGDFQALFAQAAARPNLDG